MGAIDTISLAEAAATQLQRRKKKRLGYLAWLCLGSHCLYLGRPIRQLLFWLTLGGLLLWWLADFFRLPAMVRSYNRRAGEKLLARFEEPSDWRFPELEPVHVQASKPVFLQHGEPVPAPAETAPPAARANGASALVLLSALSAAAALYVFNAPPLFPHSGAAFRALRQVNVRHLPSTASPIRAVVAKETVLNGTVEAAASGGTAGWLKVSRGVHSGGYVAVRNLEAL